ncbi:MAG TPA: aldehyde ferredoxin oxidoreductase [Pyrodictium delaneyi]|uniref:Aldehyde ferredoxin oxidoreductase n=1 Tax=Pyrodictium delaneyi TaxID=1273541 RepID=A0A833A1R3_9CREN|nr:aldehyde ferredoxin oxidoreductase [Pyrodictium delaneyi]
MVVLRFLHVDVASGEARVVEADMPSVLGPVDYGVRVHLEARSYGSPVFSARSPVVAGCGPFAGGRVFGAHRMALVFRSPVTRGLHVSTVGGVCYRFVSAGVHGVVVEGWREEPVALVLRGSADGSIEARVEEIGWDQLWEVWRGYQGLRGTRALAAYVLERYGRGLPRAGALVVGPAAARTIMAGVFSFNVEQGRPGGVVDSASRGGAGSVLLQGHGVAAVVYGGEYDPSRDNPRLRDARLLDEVGSRVLGKSYAEAVEQATVKYRYDPRLGTGGTFGVNYLHYRDLLPFFGFNTVYLSKAARSGLVDRILEELWKPVQREVFEKPGPRPWRTCGEPCPAVCKKLWRGVKIDYEPSNALGPFSGVLRAEDMAGLVELADELGIDAIEAGHIVAWLFDLLQRGMLSPGELGLGERPVFDPAVYQVGRDSRANAEAARAILEGLVEHRGWILTLVARRGLRAAAHALNLRYSGRVYMYRTGYQDVAVYSAYGERGYMTPNLYWSPGLVAPVPVPGRYWTVYSPSFAPPEELAEAVLNRMIAEYLVDNAGLCRFHRRWAEPLLQHLYRELLGLDVDLQNHALGVLRAIAQYQLQAGAEPRPWESRKTIDMVAGIAVELGDRDWGPRMASDPLAAREWWERFRKKLWSLLGLGGNRQGGSM